MLLEATSNTRARNDAEQKPTWTPRPFPWTPPWRHKTSPRTQKRLGKGGKWGKPWPEPRDSRFGFILGSFWGPFWLFWDCVSCKFLCRLDLECSLEVFADGFCKHGSRVRGTPQDGPRRSQEASKTPQTLQDIAKTANDAHTLDQTHDSCPNTCTHSFSSVRSFRSRAGPDPTRHFGTQTGSRRPKSAPRQLPDSLRGSQGVSRRSQDVSRRSKMTSRRPQMPHRRAQDAPRPLSGPLQTAPAPQKTLIFIGFL